MPLRTYKITKAPPQTPRQRRIVRDKQRASQADKLYLKHARVLVPTALVLFAAMLVPQLLSQMLTWWPSVSLSQLLGLPVPSPWLNPVAAALSAVLLGPIVTLGFTGLCLKAWRGRRFALGDLFAFCHGGRWPRALLFCAAHHVATTLPTWLASLASSLWMPLNLLTLPAAFLAGWLTLRLMPAVFLYILEPERFKNPIAALKEGFALSSGEFWAMWLYQMRLFLRSLVGLIPLAVLWVPLFMIPALAPARYLILIGCVLLFVAFISPFITMGMAGHIDSWLPSDSQVRKKEK